MEGHIKLLGRAGRLPGLIYTNRKCTLGLLPLGHPHHTRRGDVRRLRGHRPEDLRLGLLPLGHPHHTRRGDVRRLRGHRPEDLRVHEGVIFTNI